MCREVISIANDSLVQLIKKIAMDAVTTSRPCNICLGKVVDTNPVKILINQKLELDDDFLIISDTVKDKIKKDISVILIRGSGGEYYYLMDTVAGGDADAT